MAYAPTSMPSDVVIERNTSPGRGTVIGEDVMAQPEVSEPESVEKPASEESSPTSSSKVIEAISSAAAELIKYYSAIVGALTKGDDTAAGKTDDKTPDKPGQEQVVKALGTDARKIANTIFSRGVPTIPAETLSFSDIYDVTQSCTRIAKLYSMTRNDFYTQASKDKKVRDTRLAHKEAMAERLIRATTTVHDKVFV